MFTVEVELEAMGCGRVGVHHRGRKPNLVLRWPPWCRNRLLVGAGAMGRVGAPSLTTPDIRLAFQNGLFFYRTKMVIVRMSLLYEECLYMLRFDVLLKR